MTTPEPRRTPLRTCVGCRRCRPQTELVRCAAGPEGVRVSRTAPGRGAWLCSEACMQLAVRRKAFERAWRRSVTAEELGALQGAFSTVFTNMEELPAAGSSGGNGPTKG